MQEPRSLQRLSLWYFQEPWVVSYGLLYDLFSSLFLLYLLRAFLDSTMAILYPCIGLIPLALLLSAVVPSCHCCLLVAENDYGSHLYFLSDVAVNVYECVL